MAEIVQIINEILNVTFISCIKYLKLFKGALSDLFISYLSAIY